MATTKPLKIACIGCGARAQNYVGLAVQQPDRYEIVAGADPVPTVDSVTSPTSA